MIDIVLDIIASIPALLFCLVSFNLKFNENKAPMYAQAIWMSLGLLMLWRIWC